jgi:hypothetical protein
LGNFLKTGHSKDRKGDRIRYKDKSKENRLRGGRGVDGTGLGSYSITKFILVVVDLGDPRARSWFVAENKSALKIIFHFKVTWGF